MDFDPTSFYNDLGEDEWNRLDRDFYHRLEWEETTAFLERALPDSGHVLDIGGGAGRYSVWLAERGYTVSLVDPSEQQVEIASTKATESGVADHLTTEVGDVRNIQYGDDEFDATLCLGGPLSHVLTEEGRRKAVRELKRVTVPDSPVFVSVMGRLAALQTITRISGKLPPAEDETELLARLARDGTYDADLLDAFDREPSGPPMHLFRVAELERLLDEAGLRVETVTGLESIASQRRDAFEELPEEHRDVIREAVRELREDRLAADLSGHILAVARA
jgi:S-adenosylmethionine-dependent methyltransferase